MKISNAISILVIVACVGIAATAVIGNVIGSDRCDKAGGVYVDGKCLAVTQIKIWED